MKQIGDIFELDGKRYIVTYVSGENYSYAPYEEKKEPAPEPEKKEDQVNTEKEPERKAPVRTKRGRKQV